VTTFCPVRATLRILDDTASPELRYASPESQPNDPESCVSLRRGLPFSSRFQGVSCSETTSFVFYVMPLDPCTHPSPSLTTQSLVSVSSVVFPFLLGFRVPRPCPETTCSLVFYGISLDPWVSLQERKTRLLNFRHHRRRCCSSGSRLFSSSSSLR
jgi:hypothetical protein